VVKPLDRTNQVVVDPSQKQQVDEQIKKEEPVQRRMHSAEVPVYVDLNERALEHLSERGQPRTEEGRSALDLRVDGGALQVGSGREKLAVLQLGDTAAIANEAEVLARGLQNMSEAELATHGKQISAQLKEVLTAIGENRALDGELAEIEAKAKKQGAIAGGLAFLGSAVAYYAGASAVLGSVAAGLVIGTVFWPASVAALVGAVAISQVTDRGVGRAVAGSLKKLSGFVSRLTRAQEKRADATETLKEELRELGVDLAKLGLQASAG
jgi:hypothetical protein